jgi:hypothetical protein
MGIFKGPPGTTRVEAAGIPAQLGVVAGCREWPLCSSRVQMRGGYDWQVVLPFGHPENR